MSNSEFVDKVKQVDPIKAGFVAGAAGTVALASAYVLYFGPQDTKQANKMAHSYMDGPAAELKAADSKILVDLEDLRLLKYIAKTGEFKNQANEMGTDYPQMHINGKAVGRRLPAWPLRIPDYTTPATRAKIMDRGEPLTDAEVAKYAKLDKVTAEVEKKRWIKVRTARKIGGIPVANEAEFKGYIKLTDELTQANRESIGPQTDVVDADDKQRVRAFNNLHYGIVKSEDLFATFDTIRMIRDDAQSLEDEVAAARKNAGHHFKQQ